MLLLVFRFSPFGIVCSVCFFSSIYPSVWGTYILHVSFETIIGFCFSSWFPDTNAVVLVLVSECHLTGSFRLLGDCINYITKLIHRWELGLCCRESGGDSNGIINRAQWDCCRCRCWMLVMLGIILALHFTMNDSIYAGFCWFCIFEYIWTEK